MKLSPLEGRFENGLGEVGQIKRHG